MLRLRFHASWLPMDHNPFWTIVQCTADGKTVENLIEYFIEQQKSFADHYQFHVPKRSTKVKYLKAFVNDCVLPPSAHIDQILRDNDEVHFRLENKAQCQWLLVQSPPSSKRKRSAEPELPPPSNDINDILRTIAQPIPSKFSPVKESFTFQFGNKRGRPIPPRPQVISAVKVNSLVPRQVAKKKT